MGSVLGSFSEMLNTALLLAVILAAVSIGIALLLIYLLARRAWQHLRIRRRTRQHDAVHGDAEYPVPA